MSKFFTVSETFNGKDYVFFPLSRSVSIYNEIGEVVYFSSLCIRYDCCFTGMCKDCPFNISYK